ncbi:LuxR C-terminal-related transcriptional regulator [Dyadobacter subterraneus]|uniref:Response regulator transcription factor n=1 Tax=Dyadobacter subterraneus TaxID=2773304 RepID=A0ABR9W550_9BACT|nr:response regulator transcription factor [Dyadobacter subterraneus]MBE9460580.1 response regulator transcription factor [Dyadobacter subterraneus]
MYTSVEIPVTKIMLLDDHVLVAEGFKQLLLKIVPQGSVIDIFSSIDRAKESLQTGEYRVVITDLIMPGQSVMNFIPFCRKSYADIIILVVSSVMDTTSIRSCLAAGANGYVSKAVDAREIKLALEYTYNGRKFVSSDLSGKLADSILSLESTTLTSKELEIIRLIAAGHKTKNVAEMLFVSPITIMTHKRNIMRKLNLHSATELVKYVFENNLV